MRINRYLARAGVASRRGAEQIITAGRVTVNGRVVTELGTRIAPGDVVRVDDTEVAPPSTYTYVLLNKPPGYVVTLADPQGRRTVVDLLKGVDAHVVPVGRLDAPSEGLLLLTDDGDVAFRVTHPSYELDKVYEVKAKGELSDASAGRLERGIEIEGGMTSPARVRVLTRSPASTGAEVTIHEGRKRQVRRMFEAVGHQVLRLRRTRVGPLELGDLPLGEWRHLTTEELSLLRSVLGLAEGA